jgi:drug/metabolite transporter (DMT)-like permease
MFSRPQQQFYFLSVLFWGAGFALQSNIMDKALTERLPMSYAANFLLAIVVFTVLMKLRKRHTEKLGFLFLAGTGLKFLMFFLLFYPDFRSDGVMSRSEFAVFFMPYGLSSLVETVFLVRVLNRE